MRDLLVSCRDLLDFVCLAAPHQRSGLFTCRDLISGPSLGPAMSCGDISLAKYQNRMFESQSEEGQSRDAG